MPEIQTKDKLITLEELGVALNGKASVTGVKGNAEVNYRKGNVNLTPANIGAVAKAGDTMTGTLMTSADIVMTTGMLKGSDETNTNHAIRPGHDNSNHMQFFEYGGVFTFYKSINGTDTAIFQIKDGTSGAPLRVTNGGTGATEARVLIGGAGYSTILNGINAVRSTRIFPISMQKTSDYCTDAPSGCETNEANIILIGSSDRITAILHIYAAGSGKHIYVRDFFKGNWFDSQWTQIY